MDRRCRARTAPELHVHAVTSTVRLVGRYVANTAATAALHLPRLERHALRATPLNATRSARGQGRADPADREEARRAFNRHATTLVNRVRLAEPRLQRGGRMRCDVREARRERVRAGDGDDRHDACSACWRSATVDYGVGSQNISHHDQNWNARAGRGRGRHRRLHLPPERERQLLAVRRRQPAARREPGVHQVRAGRPAVRRRRSSATTSTRRRSRRTASSSSRRPGRVGERGAHRARDAAPPQLPRLPLLHRLRDRRPRALHRARRSRRRRRRPAARSTTTAVSATSATISDRTDYAGDSDSNGAYCSDINFVDADKLNGPLHTNDAFLVCGTPQFLGDTSTSWTGATASCTATTARRATRSSPTRAAPIYAAAADDAAEQLGDQGGDDRRHRRLPLHGPDADQAQLERHDDREEPVLEADEQRGRARRTAPARCRPTASSTCRTCRRSRPTRTTRTAARTT